MTLEETLAATTVNAWTIYLARAEKLFFALDDEQLQKEIAPGKNRLIYLFGHLIAAHDALFPVLGFGARRYPELDAAFLTWFSSAASNASGGQFTLTMPFTTSGPTGAVASVTVVLTNARGDSNSLAPQ